MIGIKVDLATFVQLVDVPENREISPEIRVELFQMPLVVASATRLVRLENINIIAQSGPKAEDGEIFGVTSAILPPVDDRRNEQVQDEQEGYLEQDRDQEEEDGKSSIEVSCVERARQEEKNGLTGTLQGTVSLTFQI